MVALFSCYAKQLERLTAYFASEPSDNPGGATSTGDNQRKTRQQRFISKKATQEIIAAYTAGESTVTIAERLGWRRNTISGVLKRNGVTIRSSTPDAATVRQMIQHYTNGESLATIGKRYSLSPGTVGSHLKKQGVTLRPRPGYL